MNSWLSKITGQTSSANTAKERLQLVLIHDRTDITPDTMEKLKDDLLNAISRHVTIEPSSVTITIIHEGREHRLVADIPLTKPDRRYSD